VSTPSNRRFERHPKALFLFSLFCCFLFAACARPSSTATLSLTTTCVPSAHRGDREAGPDNSITAIKSAVDRSFPFLEVDVRSSPSGALFLFHDKNLKRNNFIGSEAFINRAVSSLTDEERAAIEIPNHEKVPTLTDALRVVSHSQSTAQLDLKPDSEEMVRNVVRTIRTVPGAIPNVVIQCQELACVELLRRDYPELKVLARIFDIRLLKKALALSPALVQIDADQLSADVVALIHGVGAKLLIKSLGTPPDTKESWNALCDHGVDIVLTDHPRDF
jgi:glycerophosphoryl diester phosphodiesterase